MEYQITVATGAYSARIFEKLGFQERIFPLYITKLGFQERIFPLYITKLGFQERIFVIFRKTVLPGTYFSVIYPKTGLQEMQFSFIYHETGNIFFSYIAHNFYFLFFHFRLVRYFSRYKS